VLCVCCVCVVCVCCVCVVCCVCCVCVVCVLCVVCCVLCVCCVCVLCSVSSLQHALDAVWAEVVAYKLRLEQTGIQDSHVKWYEQKQRKRKTKQIKKRKPTKRKEKDEKSSSKIQFHILSLCFVCFVCFVCSVYSARSISVLFSQGHRSSLLCFLFCSSALSLSVHFGSSRPTRLRAQPSHRSIGQKKRERTEPEQSRRKKNEMTCNAMKGNELCFLVLLSLFLFE